MAKGSAIWAAYVDVKGQVVTECVKVTRETKNFLFVDRGVWGFHYKKRLEKSDTRYTHHQTEQSAVAALKAEYDRRIGIMQKEYAGILARLAEVQDA